MLKLCGFAVSNYHNKVKLALLEKGVAFEDVVVYPAATPEVLADSPLGKVPYLLTEQGALSESQVMMDYLEAACPDVPLVPADPFRAAKVRELVTYLELHLELVARELYYEAYFGGKVADDVKARVAKQLKRNVAALAKLAKFSPYVAGDEFTMADCAAICHFPVVSGATRKVLGEDVLAGLPVAEYLLRMEERPMVARVHAERAASYPAFMAYMKSK